MGLETSALDKQINSHCQDKIVYHHLGISFTGKMAFHMSMGSWCYYYKSASINPIWYNLWLKKKYHHCVKFTYPLSFQTRIPKVDQHTGGKWLISQHWFELWLGAVQAPSHYLNQWRLADRRVYASFGQNVLNLPKTSVIHIHFQIH